MKIRGDSAKLIILSLFGMVTLGVMSLGLTIQRQRASVTTQASSPSLEQYCVGGYYEIPGEARCSRAPNCGGRGYDDVEKLPQPNPQTCMGDGDAERSQKGCGGYVPVCCYEMARTGDFTKCVGYWERLWCAKSLCDEARSRGASDSQCGGNCQCAHASSTYCGNDAPVIPLSQRLGGEGPQNAPTNTPRPNTTPTATPRPNPTNTLIPTRVPNPTRPIATPTTQIFATNTPSPLQNTPLPTMTNSPLPTARAFTPTPTVLATEQNTVNLLEPNVGIQVDTMAEPLATTRGMEFTPPKEIARKVINPESVQKLQTQTEKTLAIPIKGVAFITKLDAHIENEATSWIQRVRVWFTQVFAR